MRNQILTGFLLLLTSFVNAQMKGIVMGASEGKREPLYGAKLKLLGTREGTQTGEDGKFELVLPKELPDTLVITAMGYTPDTVIVDRSDRFISLEITLFSEKLLPEVVIEMRRQTHAI